MKGSLRWRVVVTATYSPALLVIFCASIRLPTHIAHTPRGYHIEIQRTILFEWEGVDPDLNWFYRFRQPDQVVAKSDGRLQIEDTQLPHDLKNGNVTFFRLSDASLARAAALDFSTPRKRGASSTLRNSGAV